MEVHTPADVGALIRSARHQAGRTQAELSQAAGIARDSLIRIERGHPRVELANVLAVLEALDTTLIASSGRDSAEPSEASVARLNSLFESLEVGDDA